VSTLRGGSGICDAGFTEEDLLGVYRDSPTRRLISRPPHGSGTIVLITTPGSLGSPRLGVNAPLVVAGTLAACKKTA